MFFIGTFLFECPTFSVGLKDEMFYESLQKLTKVLLASQAIARPMSIVDELGTPSVSLKRGVVIICGERERVDIGMGLLGN